MDACFRCGRTEEQVRIFDGVLDLEAVKTCERCALIEGIPLIKLPSTEQLKTSEKGVQVYRRLKRLAGIAQEEKQKKSIFEELRQIESHPELEKPEEKPIKLVENFHWILQRERRRKGFTQKQLAEALSESETAIKMIEVKRLPENSTGLLRKLEQYFNIRIIGSEPTAATNASAARSLPSWTSRTRLTSSAQSFVAPAKPAADEPIKILSVNKEKMRNITIADLNEMHRRVEEDFPKKSSAEIGREQLEDFGKSKESAAPAGLMKPWRDRAAARAAAKSPSNPTFDLRRAEKVPSIHELLDRKRANLNKEATQVTGDDIEIIDLDSGSESKKP